MIARWHRCSDCNQPFKSFEASSICPLCRTVRVESTSLDGVNPPEPIMDNSKELHEILEMVRTEYDKMLNSTPVIMIPKMTPEQQKKFLQVVVMEREKDMDVDTPHSTQGENANPFDPNQYQYNTQRTEVYNPAIIDRLDNIGNVRLLHAALGLAKESGEIVDTVTGIVYYGKNVSPEMLQQQVKNELGDIMYFVALACNAIGIQLSEVMEANERKLRVRYPDKFSEELCERDNRNKDAERKALDQ